MKPEAVLNLAIICKLSVLDGQLFASDCTLYKRRFRRVFCCREQVTRPSVIREFSTSVFRSRCWTTWKATRQTNVTVHGSVDVWCTRRPSASPSWPPPPSVTWSATCTYKARWTISSTTIAMSRFAIQRIQWVTSLFDFTFAEPLRWAKFRSKCLLKPKCEVISLSESLTCKSMV